MSDRKLLDECLKLLHRIQKKDLNGFFLTPVDTVALMIPDYHKIITYPMDLGTVEKKLKTDQYTTIDEFANDVNQIWKNCFLYNGPDHFVSQAASALEPTFKKQFELIKKKEEQARTSATIKSELGSIKSEPTLPTGGSSITIPKPTKQTKERSSKSHRSERDHNNSDKELTFEEKRKLCLAINKMGIPAIQKVVVMINASNPDVFKGTAHDVEEITVNITHLDNKCLRQLQALVQNQK